MLCSTSCSHVLLRNDSHDTDAAKRFFKIKQWLREFRSSRNKRSIKVIKAHYWPDNAKPRLQSLIQVEAEHNIYQSSSSEDKLSSAITVSAIATSMWNSE